MISLRTIAATSASFALLMVLPVNSADVPAKTAGITGTVRFTGEVPNAKKIALTDGTTLEHRDLLVDPKTKGLRYVVAVLENVPAQKKLAGAKAVVVDQRDMIFTPRVIAIQHGTPARFENSDNCNHGVNADSTVKANQFNVTTPSNQSYEHVFEPQRPPVQIGCALHAWMRAWVYVLPHPWFAVSDVQGAFKISNVPAGKHALWLRHPDTGLQERLAVEVEAGKDAEVKVEWKALKAKE